MCARAQACACACACVRVCMRACSFVNLARNDFDYFVSYQLLNVSLLFLLGVVSN